MLITEDIAEASTLIALRNRMVQAEWDCVAVSPKREQRGHLRGD